MATFHNRWIRRIALLGLLCLGAFPKAADEGGADIAIVVRPDVPVDNLTFPELRRLMLGEKQYWTSSLRVTLLVRAPGAREREVVLRPSIRCRKRSSASIGSQKCFALKPPAARASFTPTRWRPIWLPPSRALSRLSTRPKSPRD